MKTRTRWSIVGRGKNGWHAQGVDSNPTTHISSSGGPLEGYVSESADGTPVYDADGADWNTFAKLIIHGPLLKVDMNPDHVSHFADKVNSWQSGTVETREPLDGESFGPLDYLGMNVWLKRLRALVPGVKFGVVQNGSVVWETP